MIYREIVGDIKREYEGTPEEISEMLNIMDKNMEEEKIVNNTINYNAIIDKEDLIEYIVKGYGYVL